MKFEERYKLQVPIEQSERGTLWSGQDTKLSRKVVVAVVEADAPEALRERFAEQMGKLAALRHANLVRVLEVGRTEEDAPFASMELAEGDTLAKRMVEGPPMRADQAIRMIADLCGALSALHAAGIAHGDVHPGNVLVKELGGRVTPKLAGVGLNGAEQRRGGDEAEALLALAYMAPAQARGEVLADAASDVYSTAAMVFSLLTGRLPHRGGSAEALRAAVKDRAAPSAADVRAELAGPIAEVLDMALSPDPAKRFDTADALAKGLRAALIRTRTPGAIETVVGPRALESDESDVELAEKRDAPKPAAAPARAAIAKPGASRGVPPAKPLPKPSSKDSSPKPAVTSATEAPKVEVEAAEPASAAAPSGEPVSDEALEFERLSGLLEVSEVFAGAARPPPPPKDAHADDAQGATKKDDSLEFERLSGLLEIGKLEGEAPPPPPPPPGATSAPSEKDDAEASEASAPRNAAPEEKQSEASAVAVEAATGDASDKPPAALKAAVETKASAKEEAPKAAKEAPATAATTEAAKGAKDAAPKATKGAPARAAATESPAKKAAPAKDAEVFEAEEIAGMTSGPPPWVWAAVGVSLAAAIVIGGVVVSSGDEPGEETALAEPPSTDEAVADAVEQAEEPAEDVTATAALASPGDPTPSDSEPAPEVAAPVEPAAVEEPALEQITLTLTGVPAGATVTVDGAAVEGTEIALAPTDAARTIAVRLAGHEDWSRSVPGDSSADVRVDLVELAAAEEAPREPRAARRRASRNERAQAQRSRTERARPERSRAERARPERARAQPARRTTRRPGSRPTAVSDPGF